jgi:DNA repair protein RecO (recombination protein O)
VVICCLRRIAKGVRRCKDTFAMSYLRDTAIILKAEPFREQDTWVTMYGREHGKLIAVARGARRMSAKSLGHLQPCSEVEVMIAKGAAFDKLAVVQVVRPRVELRQCLEGMALAGAFVDALERLTRPAFADRDIHTLLVEVLDTSACLKAEMSPLRGQVLFAAASLKLLGLLGYAPSLDACARCRGTIEAMWLTSEASGFVCGSCIRTTVGRVHGPLPGRTDSLVRFLRAASLADILRVTANRDQLLAAIQTVDGAFHHAPLSTAPHGSVTVQALLA